MKRRVVIVGAGFAGLHTARALHRRLGRKGREQVQITVVDRSNHHLFQPLLYQVATAGLAPSQIATPIRSVLRDYPEIDVLMGEVKGVDLAKREIQIEGAPAAPYDHLVIATGARHGYFGHDEWEKFAPGLKSVEDATRIRQRVLFAFETAETEQDTAARSALLTFAIVGGGPTGVELAGAIAELAHAALARDFRHIDPQQARVILLEAGPRILAAFPETLSQSAARELERLGVEVRAGERVEKIDEAGVWLKEKLIAAKTVIWAAGVFASPAGKWLGAPVDKAGRVQISPDLSVPGHPDIFVIGDTSTLLQDGRPLPGVAPTAMQEGTYVGKLLADRILGHPAPAPFRYLNKGNLATIGRRYAIADLGAIKLRGTIAWLAWLVIHIFYLIGFRAKVLVMLDWAWSYATFQRGARLITSEANPFKLPAPASVKKG